MAHKRLKNETCCQRNQCWEQETLCCSSWLCPLMWGPGAQNNPKQYTQNDTASRPLTVLVLMVSSATAFNNWKAKLALFSVFIRSYVDGSHLDPVSTCLTREKKRNACCKMGDCSSALHIQCRVSCFPEIPDFNNSLYVKWMYIKWSIGDKATETGLLLWAGHNQGSQYKFWH